MKALHNHIFSKTDCISKQEMLKYINRQLSKKELHKIETHLLDCPFCTEAFEGIRHAQNPSLLFEIDEAIDKKTISSSNRLKFNNWLVAATLIAVFALVFFIVNKVTKDLSDQKLAVNQNMETIVNNAEPNTHSNALESKEYSSNAEVSAEPENENQETSAVREEKLPEMDKTEVPVIKDELKDEVASNNNREALSESNPPEKTETLQEVLAFEEQEDAYKATTSVMETNIPEAAIAITKNHNSFNRVEEKSTQDGRSTLRSKTNKQITNTVYSAETKTDADDTEKKAAPSLPAKYLHGLKVVDYTQPYSEAYREQKELEEQSLSPQYENIMDKKAEESDPSNPYQEITYKDLLDDAIKNFKDKKYEKAKSQFLEILKKHPQDVNAQFYLGLCYFHLGDFIKALNYFELTTKNEQQAFNQEADWYGALCLKNTGQIKAAKKAFKQIANKGGFYAKRAQKELDLILSQEDKTGKQGQSMEDNK